MYNPKTKKGMGRFYDNNHRAFKRREWKGFKDSFYEYHRWLKLYGTMALKLGVHPILMVKALFRYRWMISYLTAANTIDKHTIGLFGKELRYTHEQFFAVVRNSINNVALFIVRDENLRPKSKKAAKLRNTTVMFDEMIPKFIMAGFPSLQWMDIAMLAVGLPSEIDQLANPHYIDAIERFGLAADICPFPATEVGVAICNDYPRVGKTFITSSMPCDGSVQEISFMARLFKGMPMFQITPPQRFLEPEVQTYAVKNLKKAIKFIEDNYNVKWNWDAFWKASEMYNYSCQCMLNKWDINCTDYPQVCNGTMALYREYEFMGAGCLDPYFMKVNKKVDAMMKKGYEYDKAHDIKTYKHRAIVWACPAHFYTNFTFWADHCWGVRTMVDMECMLSHHFIHIGDKDQAMIDLALLYEKMMMRSHTNGGYVNSLDECWKIAEKFRAKIVIMYDHVSCKNVGGLHGMYEEEGRKRGLHVMWIPHDLMDARTVSRREMREAFNKYMTNCYREEPQDPTLVDYEDILAW